MFQEGQLHRDIQQAARKRAGIDSLTWKLSILKKKIAESMGEKETASCLKNAAIRPRQP